MMRSLTSRFARKLLSGSKKPSRTPTFKPQIESLEHREVLSASSAGPHAVLPGPVTGAAIEQVFYIDKSDGGLYYVNDQGPEFGDPVRLNNGQGPQNVQALSAGLASNGNADVFAEAGDGSLWEYNLFGAGWKELLGAHQVESFAAVDGGRAFAIFSDGTLHLYNGAAGWSSVPTPGTVKAIDAVTNKFGYDTVYVLNGDDSFGEVSYLPALSVASAKTAKAASATITPPPVSALRPVYTQLLPAFRLPSSRPVYEPAVVSFSAGTNATGYADVYATLASITGSHNLYQNLSNTSTGWVLYAASGTFTAFSATDQGQVWLQGPTYVREWPGGPLGPGVVLCGSNGFPVYVGGYEVVFSGQFTSLDGLGQGSNFNWSLFAVDADGDLVGYSYENLPGTGNESYPEKAVLLLQVDG